MLRMQIFRLAAGVGLALMLTASGCSKNNGGGATVKLNVMKSASSYGSQARLRRFAQAIYPPLWGAGDNAQNATLTSLKYVFGMIELCKDLTTEGSRWTTQSGCSAVYQGPVVGDGSSGSITPDNLATYASQQIDLMDDGDPATSPHSRKKLNASAT